MLTRGTLAELHEEQQMHGPLEGLFLSMTKGDRPTATILAEGSDGAA